MKKTKEDRGITLIALIIMIVVLLILAGISFNGIVGDNGIVDKAMNSKFLSEMTEVQEAFEVWQAEHYDDNKLPSSGIVQLKDIKENGRLYGEIAYYRRWSETGTIPEISVELNGEKFNGLYDGDLNIIPRGVEDLYYVDNEKLGIEGSKKYIIDTVNGMIYSMSGYTVKNVDVHSLAMYKILVNGVKDSPKFAKSVLAGSGDDIIYAGEKYYRNKNGDYLDKDGNVLEDQEDETKRVINPNGFKILTSKDNRNIYKLYNNGDLYGKGLKGTGLQTSDEEMEKIDSTVFQELELPAEIPNPKKVIQGENECLYVVDESDRLWAIGTNTNNKFGLNETEQQNYTGYEPVRLNVDNKKFFKLFDIGVCLFVITEDGKLYAAGQNNEGELGIGSTDSVNKFTEVKLPDENMNYKNIYQISGSKWGVIIWYNDSGEEEFSDAWYNSSKFYYTGKSGFCIVGDGKTNNTDVSFRRIWNGGDCGGDIDSEIKYLSCLAATVIVKRDGKLYWCGYGSYDGGIGGASTASTKTFGVKKELENVSIEKFWICASGFGCVAIDDNDNIWVRASYNTAALGESEINYDFHKLTNAPFKGNEIKDVITTRYNFYYLLNDGRLYGCGNPSYLGIEDSEIDSENGLYLLNGEGSVLPKIDSLGDQKCVIGDFEASNSKRGLSGYQLFVGNDDKIYIVGSSLIMFGGDVSEKSWTKIASNVENYYPTGTSYISSSGELFVSGEHSDYLGLGYENDKAVKDFTKVEGFGESKKFGKAEKFVFSGVNSYVLTEDGTLYGTGLYNYNGYQTYAGWKGSDNKTEYVKILDNIKDFDSYESGNGADSFKIAVTNDDKLYSWGNKLNSIDYANGELEPKLQEINDSIKDIKSVEIMNNRRCFIITNDGKLYIAGTEKGNYYDGGFTAISKEFVEYTKINLDADEKVIDIAMDGNLTDLVILTDKGRLFGYGTCSCIGKGQGTNYAEIGILDVDSVCSVSGGSGFFVAVKNDGTVWGTGRNDTGVLGRWSTYDDSGNNSKIESRFQTAFLWVECKELEF